MREAVVIAVLAAGACASPAARPGSDGAFEAPPREEGLEAPPEMPADQAAASPDAASDADADAGFGIDAIDSVDATDASEASDVAAAAEAPLGCSGLFCEDFEQGLIDPAKWSTPAIGGATLNVQQKIVAHGKYAVQLHGLAAPKSPDYVYIISKAAPTALQKHNFGRAYLYLSPQRNDIDMGMIWGGTSGFPKPTYMSIANHGTGWQLGFIKLSGAPTGERQAYPPGDIPVARWFCLEWEMNDEPDELTLWSDGKLIGSLNDRTVAYPPGITPGTPLYDNKNTGLIGAFTDFGFGFYDWHPENRPAFDLYYDDIVLDTKRPGCLTP